jgi:XapX domain-containing protein
MKEYLCSFAIGCAVDLLYATLRTKSPAPPLIALVGLLGMLLGEGGCAWLKTVIR